MKLVTSGLLIAFCVLVLAARPTSRDARSPYVVATTERFTQDARAFATSLTALKNALNALQPHDTATAGAARGALQVSRMRYKRIEFFMEYFFDYPVNLYNRAPVYEVEEPYAEYQSPIGLQVIEGLLLEEDPYAQKKGLIDQCEVLEATATDIPAQLYGFTATDAQVLESLRLELVRILTLGITGYDAPQLKTGMPEAAEALAALRDNLELRFAEQRNVRTAAVERYLQQSIDLLLAHPSFDGFDRLHFLTQAALPLQEALGQYIATQGGNGLTPAALNASAAHLFRADALNVAAFSDTGASLPGGPQVAALGGALFEEPALSGNGRRSCSTCHQPGKAFTDGLTKSRALDERGELARNAPTLYYAAYQRAQFYDGRARSLEAQIRQVLQNPHEMDAHLDTVAARLNGSPRYRPLFEAAFGLQPGQPVTIAHAAAALAAYEQTLAPFSSPFDRYMNGDSLAMSAQQKQGFNLFMGKAQCGTCHFAPLFNGLLPPYYERSESEVLGVPMGASRRHPVLDTDSGRSGFFAISFNQGAFKTSTVRNVARTAPYMHNGVFKTLGAVVDFYNKGGGRGLKLPVANQTLSDRPLGLSAKEKKALIAFLMALTDEVPPRRAS